MTDRDIDNMLWRAFLFGARVIAKANGEAMSATEISTIAGVARSIAEGDITLEDPTAMVNRFPDNADTFQRLGTLSIRNYRELAERIVSGFEIAAEIKK